MQAGHLKLALVLGLLSLGGPFSIDMYLPALPSIARELAVTEGAAQASLTAFFATFGIAQMIYGPWADQAGRRLPLMVGMSLFLVASLGAMTAGSIEALVAWRAVQGAGAAVAMVVPRAVIRDTGTGPAATRLMAMIMLVISISPMVAPLAGSGVIAVAGWRAIFGVVAALAVTSLLLTGFVLPETLKPQHRVPVNLRSLRRGIGQLLRDPKFVGLTFTGGLAMASFFVFIASAPFVYTGQYGLSPAGFSLCFALNAIGFFASSQAAGPLAERWGMTPVIRTGMLVFVAATTLLWAAAAAGFAPLWLVIGALFVGNAGLGVVIPSVMVMALDDHGPVAGLASSLGGTLQMLTGGLAIAVAGPFFDGTVVPMVAAIALCGLGALAVAAWTLRRGAEARA